LAECLCGNRVLPSNQVVPAAVAGFPAETPTATARLKHSMEIVGSSTVEIAFDATSVKLQGGFQGWLSYIPAIDLPGLQQVRPC
jgi:hypothetical protein